MKTVSSFLFLIPNTIFVMALLWFLAWVGSYFYSKDDNDCKTESFECGFENTSLGDVKLNFKNTIVMAFLLVYDLELVLLLPISFNIQALDSGLVSIFLIIAVVLYTCIWDIETNTLEYEN